MAGVVNDGMGAGFADDHIKKGDARVIAHTKIVGGGQSTSVKFATSLLKKGEAYSFFCTFPGHSALMKGAFKFG
jgi:azurin